MIKCHDQGQNSFVNREPAGHRGASAGKPAQNRGDFSNFRNVQTGWALRMVTGKAFNKSPDPVLLFYFNIFEFVEGIHFEHFGRASKSAGYAQFGCFLGFGKL